MSTVRTTSQVWRIIQAWMDGQLVAVTQSKVAEAIGVQRSALSQWKLGQARPSPANLRRVQEITRVPYRQLLDALLVDMGYLSIEEMMGNAQHPAPRYEQGGAKPPVDPDTPPGDIGMEPEAVEATDRSHAFPPADEEADFQPEQE